MVYDTRHHRPHPSPVLRDWGRRLDLRQEAIEQREAEDAERHEILQSNLTGVQAPLKKLLRAIEKAQRQLDEDAPESDEERSCCFRRYKRCKTSKCKKSSLASCLGDGHKDVLSRMRSLVEGLMMRLCKKGILPRGCRKSRIIDDDPWEERIAEDPIEAFKEALKWIRDKNSECQDFVGVLVRIVSALLGSSSAGSDSIIGDFISVLRGDKSGRLLFLEIVVSKLGGLIRKVRGRSPSREKGYLRERSYSRENCCSRERYHSRERGSPPPPAAAEEKHPISININNTLPQQATRCCGPAVTQYVAPNYTTQYTRSQRYYTDVRYPAGYDWGRRGYDVQMRWPSSPGNRLLCLPSSGRAGWTDIERRGPGQRRRIVARFY